jgi:tetratricopeptide (TPR) repeat protein
LETQVELEQIAGKITTASTISTRAPQRQPTESTYTMHIAKTLHELGVTRIKQKDPVAANNYLQESLNLLQRKGGHGYVGDSGGIVDGAGTSSTLYQLAVVAVIDKPPRLDDAERLLHEVLAVEGQDGAARSATLQQLGRVASRRGKLELAEKYLVEALAGYQQAYRSKRHVNVASVHQSLGTLYTSKKEFVLAEKHLLESLDIRTKLCGGDVYGARFRQKFAPKDAIGSHACSLEANTRLTDCIPLGVHFSYQCTLSIASKH